MSRATLRAVNRAVARAGIPLELVRGDGYHYWVLDTPKRYETHSECVCYTSSVPVETWVEWARAAYQHLTA
jgi:hypothetical protein